MIERKPFRRVPTGVHYSDKGGHLETSKYHQGMRSNGGLHFSPSPESWVARRFQRRIPRSGR